MQKTDYRVRRKKHFGSVKFHEFPGRNKNEHHFYLLNLSIFKTSMHVRMI